MLLLASASPARRRLLEQAGIPHRVRVSGVDESAWKEADPTQLVQRLAQAKAEAVAALVRDGEEPLQRNPQEPPLRAVLGCDSLLLFDGEVHGKPRDAAEAIARWQRLAGGCGDLLTGHCWFPLRERPVHADASALRLEVVATRVHFAPISPAEIEAYVASGEPLHCAGGFALEGRGGLVVERLEGCFSNVIGLSLPLLRRWLLA